MAHARLPAARLAALCAAAALLSACSRSPAAAGPRFVILVSLDTVPAKHCSLYGYERPTTPFLEELGARGAVFEHHVANSNNTLKSHASILTGLLPPAHGTHDAGDEGERRALAPEFETLAERFQEAGYRTAAFVTHAAWLSHDFGMDQGFDTFDSAWRGAEENNRRVLAWLDAERPERAFLFLHYFDAHSDGSDPGDLPYEAPPEYLARFAGEKPADYDGSTQDRLGNAYHGSRALAILANPWRELPPAHLAYLKGSYDAGLAKLDHDLAALFDGLERRGVLADALVVVTSDHGEEFKEHGGLLHQQFYDEVMHVPLVVVLPGGRKAARPRVTDLTRSIDLAPTVLDLCGLEPLPHAQGRSFSAALLTGGRIPYRDTLFESLTLRARDEVGEYKYRADETGPGPCFFDLDRDPGETHDLLREPGFATGARVAGARARLAALGEECELVRKAVAASDGKGPSMTPEEVARLRDLGYLGTDEDAPPDDGERR
jgi:arylsulfatase A-like enzyme